MILGDPNAPHIEASGRLTIDDLFRRAAARRPDAIALSDPPNRSDFTDGGPRTLTYAQANHAISAIAGRLRRLGLAADAVVALHLPNTVESVLTLLGVLRAGLIAAPLPLLWRRKDAAAALARVGARAIVTMSRVGQTDYSSIAMTVAADVFPIRYVCSFGDSIPDGVIPFEDLLVPAPLLETELLPVREGNPADHVAIVTFELTPSGLIAVGRSHAELMAGGQAVVLESGLPADADLLSCCAANSFAGLASGLLPWLMTGGRLALHHAFSSDAFAAQCRDSTAVVVPAVLASRIAKAGLMVNSGLQNVIALWRAPERLAVSEPWPHPKVRLIDVLAFGETAVICGRRSASGIPVDLPLGPTSATREASGAVAETTVTLAGTLAVRGEMVPRHAFPPGAERARQPFLGADPLGFVDTHFPCRADRTNSTVELMGPPTGIVNVGGYRFRLDDLNALASSLGDVTLTVLPEALSGHRLAGVATDRTAVLQELEAIGHNPLIAAAFQTQRRSEAA